MPLGMVGLRSSSHNLWPGSGPVIIPSHNLSPPWGKPGGFAASIPVNPPAIRIGRSGLRTLVWSPARIEPMPKPLDYLPKPPSSAPPRPKSGLRKRAEEKAVAKAHIAGASISTIARMFDMAPEVVKRKLSSPEVLAYYTTASEVVTTQLLPLALEVAEEKLRVDRDRDMAKEVLFGTGILNKNVRVQAVASSEDNYLDWRRQRLEQAAISTYGRNDAEGVVIEASDSGHAASGPDAPDPPGQRTP